MAGNRDLPAPLSGAERSPKGIISHRGASAQFGDIGANLVRRRCHLAVGKTNHPLEHQAVLVVVLSGVPIRWMQQPAWPEAGVRPRFHHRPRLASFPTLPSSFRHSEGVEEVSLLLSF